MIPSKGTGRTSWDHVAEWYVEAVGEEGSRQHRTLTIPAAMELLRPRAGEQVLDVGAGPGVLAPVIARAGARYTGVDVSPRLLAFARRHHGRSGRFLLADTRRLPESPELRAGSFDAAVFLLSIQDMDPLTDVLDGVAWALRGGGRVVIVMTHPCFRVPRQSGWGWDDQRRIAFRRVDRYLTSLQAPVGTTGPGSRSTVRFHRPLQAYVNELARHGFLVDRMLEIAPTHKASAAGPLRNRIPGPEFPMFLGLRARALAP